MTALALRRRALKPFSPASLPSLAMWMRADGTVYQDSARTMLAVADDDPVASS